MAPTGKREREKVVWVKGMKMGDGAPHDGKTEGRIDVAEDLGRVTGEGTERRPKVCFSFFLPVKALLCLWLSAQHVPLLSLLPRFIGSVHTLELAPFSRGQSKRQKIF